MLFSYHLLYFCTALSLIIMLSSHYHHHKSKTFSQLTQCPFTGTLLLLEKHEWSVTFELPYKILREPYFQSFQYKILHRIVNFGDNLFKWNIIDSPKCHYCTFIDTIEHHFFYCEIIQAFLENLEMKLKNIHDREIKLSICEILLGLNSENFSLSHCINTVIIWGKWYINKTRSFCKAVFS